LDWPADGLGWGGRVPDTVMIGGVNGSGKSTLLRCIAGAWLAQRASFDGEPLLPIVFAKGTEIFVDFQIESARLGTVPFRFFVGNQGFVDAHRTPGSFGSVLQAGYESRYIEDEHSTALLKLRIEEDFTLHDMPRVVYFTSEGRTLITPTTEFKAAGVIDRADSFLYVWSAPQTWAESTEALLYAARWEDLNAKEEGRPEEATRFRSYAKAYEMFFGEGKRLRWTHRGELVVEIYGTGATHPLTELSSGEKQILVLASELLYAWKPGSLVLIDEPEMHLHVTWQMKLWQALLKWQKERGGQLIVATQSSDLFGAAEPGTHLLLGRPLR
jgi:energy-coupling factor transporter ATP-binding protein EcfA2